MHQCPMWFLYLIYIHHLHFFACICQTDIKVHHQWKLLMKEIVFCHRHHMILIKMYVLLCSLLSIVWWFSTTEKMLAGWIITINFGGHCIQIFSIKRFKRGWKIFWHKGPADGESWSTLKMRIHKDSDIFHEIELSIKEKTTAHQQLQVCFTIALLQWSNHVYKDRSCFHAIASLQF